MSLDGTKLLFEGFLQKRKDTLKIRWVTYWFRLQNTTLFFYTKKNGGATHLRGHYYIFRVQSVREIKKNDRKPFLFEIIMMNGKRKILAAETADLRKEWVGHLWQAMQMSSSGIYDPGITEFDLYDRERLNSDSVMEVVPLRPMSTFSTSEHIYAETGGISLPSCVHEEEDSNEDLYQNVKQPLDRRVNAPQPSGHLRCEENKPEELYDVLPSRTSRCEAPEAEMDEVVYDFPASYKDPTEQQENIYDVPSCVLRRSCDLTEDDQMEEETYWMI
nr:uncharacterized protein LOC107376598 [Nothobranchius furzeri]